MLRVAAGQNSSGSLRPVTVQPGPPRALEDVVEGEHGHVASHAVAVRCQFAELPPHRLARLGIEVVQLGDVAPRGKIRVPAAGHVHRPLHAVHRSKVIRSGARVFVGSEHISLRMLPHPAMIEPGVIRDEVEDQPDSAAAQFFARGSETGPPTHSSVGIVAVDAIGRSDDVVRRSSRGGRDRTRASCRDRCARARVPEDSGSRRPSGTQG